MRQRANNLRNSTNSGFLSFIERFWVVILGLIIFTPVLLRYLKDASVKNQTNDAEEEIKLTATANLSPITQLVGMNKITTNQGYHKWALSLSQNLGTLYSNRGKWYDIPSWLRSLTENDKKVYELLKNVTNTSQKRILNELYFFLVQRNLNEDVTTLLDPELLIKLPMFR